MPIMPATPISTAITVPVPEGMPNATTPPTTPTSPATSIGSPPTWLASRNVSSSRMVALVRTPANGLRRSAPRQPRKPTVPIASPASASTMSSSRRTQKGAAVVAASAARFTKRG